MARRLLRYAFTLLTAFSLLLCAGLAFVGVSDSRGNDSLVFQLHHRSIELAEAGGTLYWSHFPSEEYQVTLSASLELDPPPRAR